jgi:hypothetical protein
MAGMKKTPRDKQAISTFKNIGLASCIDNKHVCNEFFIGEQSNLIRQT